MYYAMAGWSIWRDVKLAPLSTKTKQFGIALSPHLSTLLLPILKYCNGSTKVLVEKSDLNKDYKMISNNILKAFCNPKYFPYY